MQKVAYIWQVAHGLTQFSTHAELNIYLLFEHCDTHTPFYIAKLILQLVQFVVVIEQDKHIGLHGTHDLVLGDMMVICIGQFILHNPL